MTPPTTSRLESFLISVTLAAVLIAAAFVPDLPAWVIRQVLP